MSINLPKYDCWGVVGEEEEEKEIEKGETRWGQREIKVPVSEDRCPALVNKLKRKYIFICCGHGENLENVKLPGLKNTQPWTKIPDFLL